MAKRKKRKKAATATKPFVALFTECGSVDQLAALDLYSTRNAFETADEAKQAIADHVQGGGVDGTFVVAQIIDTGSADSITWKGKTTL